MAFAIFYELEDLSSIAGSIQASSLPQQMKGTINHYWQGGVKNWDTAPVGQSPSDPPGACPACRTLVVTYGTLAEFRQLLLDVAAALGTDAARYLIALSQDMGGSSGAVEPWPPA